MVIPKIIAIITAITSRGQWLAEKSLQLSDATWPFTVCKPDLRRHL